VAGSKDDLIDSISECDRNAFLGHVHVDIFNVDRFRRLVVTLCGSRHIGNSKEFLFGEGHVYSKLKPE
jgi:hypothetical protein